MGTNPLDALCKRGNFFMVVMVFVGLLLIRLYLIQDENNVSLFEFGDPVKEGESHRRIEISMIVDTGNAEKYAKSKTFMSSYFPDDILIKEWSGVYAEGCPTVKPLGQDEWHSPAKLVGISMAHKRIWEEYIFRNKTSESDYLIVLEDDIICAVHDCGGAALSAVRHTSTDILYLGWCPDDAVPPKSPYCTHAYALSSKGVQTLYRHVRPCLGALDTQVYRIVQAGLLTWATVPLPADINQATITRGYFTQNW